jgi:hypothetical protein
MFAATYESARCKVSACVWGGHSCPPLLTLILKIFRVQNTQSTLTVKSGGQECPPHTDLFLQQEVSDGQDDHVHGPADQR